MLPRPRTRAAEGRDRPAVEAIDRLASEGLDGSPAGRETAPPSDRPGEPGERRPVVDPERSAPAQADGCLRVADSARRVGSGENLLPDDLVGVEGDESWPAGQRLEAPVGASIAEGGRRRAGDLVFLVKRCPIRPQLQEFGNTRDFDATAWRRLRPIAGEILARRPDGGRAAGLYAPFVVDLIRAKPPGEWSLCPGCGGSGRARRGGSPCEVCLGCGYRLEFPDGCT